MRILIIEDKKSLREMLSEFLEEGNFVLSADSAEKGEKLLLHHPEIVLCDLKLPGISGLEFIQKHSKNFSNTYFIMMTAFGDIPTTVEAMKSGAYDFLSKPLDLNHLKFKLKKIRELIRLKKREAISNKNTVVFNSATFKNILNLAEKFASGIGPILITGESGTGKEIIAKFVHDKSTRNKEIFYSINCAAIPENLIESEIFGYEEGAFTGASKRKAGIFEVADNGTLLLDEIGDTSPSFQAKLLRVIENRKFIRVGGNSEISFDVRMIFATNKNLQQLVKQKLFREDLFYRISSYTIEIPPLRERKEDIKPLAQYFAGFFGLQVKGKPYKLKTETINNLENMPLPGNVRELKNYVERWVISGVESELNHENQSYCLESYSDIEEKTYSEIMSETENKVFSFYLNKFKGNKQAVANALELNYKTLLTKLKKLNLK